MTFITSPGDQKRAGVTLSISLPYLSHTDDLFCLPKSRQKKLGRHLRRSPSVAVTVETQVVNSKLSYPPMHSHEERQYRAAIGAKNG